MDLLQPCPNCEKDGRSVEMNEAFGELSCPECGFTMPEEFGEACDE